MLFSFIIRTLSIIILINCLLWHSLTARAGQDSQSDHAFLHLIALADSADQEDTDMGLYYLDSALTNAINSERDDLMVTALIKKGSINNRIKNYGDAVQNYLQALSLCNDNTEKSVVIEISVSLASIYQEINDHEKALPYFNSALSAEKPVNDMPRYAWYNQNIGYSTYKLNRYSESLVYYTRAKNQYEEAGMNIELSEILNLMGIVYHDWGKHQEAADYFEKSFHIRTKIGDNELINESLCHLGELFFDWKKYEKAMEYMQRILSSGKSLENDELMAKSMLVIGKIHKTKDEADQAIVVLDEALKHAQAAVKPDLIISLYKELSELFETKGDLVKSLEYFKMYVALRDFNMQSFGLVSELETKYEIEKNEKEIVLLNKENLLKENEAKRQKNFAYSAVGGVILLIIIAILIMIQSFHRKKTNRLLLSQKSEIEEINEELIQQKEEIQIQAEYLVQVNHELGKHQNQLEDALMTIENKNRILEVKNNETTDNIMYAKHIQDSILLHDKIIRQTLSESFILFKPKDILSGDFYWFETVSNGVSKPDGSEISEMILFAAVDCTGHGVSGAFMSLVANNLLNHAVIELKKTRPSEILKIVNEGLFNLWKNSATESGIQIRDGMDIALISINPSKSTLSYAGAKNPLYLFRDGELKVYKPGYLVLGWLPQTKAIGQEEYEIPIQKGDIFYIFSDGYADQFGGKHSKKLKYDSFRNILTECHVLPMEEQKSFLEKTFKAWQGNQEQIDDVLVIGVKF